MDVGKIIRRTLLGCLLLFLAVGGAVVLFPFVVIPWLAITGKLYGQ